jgi:D-serine deaminase-like pyridoxal phosphate-dependent protein
MHPAELDTPSLVVDVEVMERNIRRLADYCAVHGLKLRPHTKTHKVPEIARMQVAHGAAGITVAKIGEAEVMADAGLNDILIVYPLFGEAKWDRLVRLAGRARIAVAMDSAEIARKIAERARQAGVPVGILAEFDTGFHRCGLPIESASIEIVKRIRDLAGPGWLGILVYPGHIMGTSASREPLIAQQNAVLARLFGMLDAAGIASPVVSGGNTPAAYSSHRFQGITEIRPGTYVFNDKDTVCAEAAAYEDCALTVWTSVVSVSVSGKAMVDAGSKTLSADSLLSGDRRGFGHVLGHPEILIEDLSEEHGHLDVTLASRPLKLGEKLCIVPNHVCTCVNLHDTIYGVLGDEVVVEWKVAARGRVR